MQEIAYRVVRSKRKSVALVIDHAGDLIVRAPARMPATAIESFVREKARWINEKQQQVAAFRVKHPPIAVETGKSLMYLGDSYTISKDPVAAVEVFTNKLIVPENYDLEALTAWLKEQARQIISERVAWYADIMGDTPGAIKISGAKTRWGSCTAKDDLTFSWRLIMCPLSVIDYVVVHELSHITHKNHSSAFWERVKTVLPTYKIEREWLKANSELMGII